MGDAGIDPNRNYPMGWDGDAGGPKGTNKWMYEGVGREPCGETYGGPSPFSAACIRQLVHFLKETDEGRSVKIVMNFHTWGNLYIIPFSYITTRMGAEDWVNASDERIIELMKDYLCPIKRNDILYMYYKEYG